MAVRKTNRKARKKSKSHGSALVIFFLAFFVIIAAVFMFNAETIKKNFNLFWTRVSSSPGAGELESDEKPEVPAEPPIVAVIQESTSRSEPTKPASTTEPTKPAPEKPEPAKPALQQRPQTQPQVQPQTPSQPPAATQTRDRSIYFTQVNKDGQILHSKVSRKVTVSDSPMQDVLAILLKGPASDELNRGIINMIPQNTRVLSAVVRGNTAYISFSEDFMFNTFGVEGYVAQLRQIVWTVTEFSNVNDVQILIEGRRVDYLGEGIWIGSPISRQSF